MGDMICPRRSSGNIIKKAEIPSAAGRNLCAETAGNPNIRKIVDEKKELADRMLLENQ